VLNNIEIKTFEDIFALKSGITDIYRKEDVFYISSETDSIRLISTYNTTLNYFNKNHFVLNDYKIKTGIHFDKKGNYFYINSKNQLIIKPI